MTPQSRILLELERARAKNARYSLRAMAGKLGLPPGRLSEVLSGKRLLTAEMARKIADRLEYDPATKSEFLASVDRVRQTSKNAVTATPAKLKSIQSPSYQKIEMDHFHVIADWHHFAILSLMETKDFVASSIWIAERLGITVTQADSALERLKSTGLISVSPKGRLRSTGRNIETSTDVSSTALKRSHRQTLEQAIEAIYDVGVEDRDITSMTMAIDSKKLPRAKQLIREFRKKLAAFLEVGTADEVYNLNVQLIPVTKRIVRKK